MPVFWMNKKKINKAISQGRVAENRRAKFDYSIIFKKIVITKKGLQLSRPF